MPDSVTKDPVSEVQFPPTILDDVSKLVQRVQTFTGAAGAAIALREGEEMVCRASRGNNAPDVGMVLSLDGTFTGLAVTGMKAVRCDDTENDPRVDAEISRTLRIKSMAVVPVLSGMRVTGVIATFASNNNAFSDTHMAVLKTMADGLGANLQRWLESQGISTSAPVKNPLRPGIAAQPKPEPTQPEASPSPRTEAPKPVQVVIATPKIETPAARPAATVSTPVAAATAPAVDKTAEPKKPETKSQGKWKPVVVPKQEPEATIAAVKPQLKSEPAYSPAPSFSYDASSDASESKKSPMLFVGIAAAVLVIAGGGYFMFGRSAAKPATSAPAVSSTSEPTTAAPTTAALTTTPTQPSAATTTKLDPAKTLADKGADKPKTQTAQVDDVTVTKRVAAPLVVAPTSVAAKPADDAPPSIALAAANAGPALDIPVTTSAPRLSTPAPVNAVVVPSRLVQRINPNYPVAARQYRVEGAVTLSATIGPDGRVHDAKVISGPPMLRDAAVGAVKQWKYAPSTVNGRAVESSVQIVLQFKIPS
jgi:TonB family protein